jgi:nitrogen fixation NifU-like protein
MMTELTELYQEVILDHNRRPRNFHALAEASHTAEGYNPLCGDRLTLYLKINGDRIEEAAFQGAGCAISKASASMMTDELTGRTVDEAIALFERFHRMVTSPPDQGVEDMGKLSSLAGVRQFPVRVKCASLAWHTLKAAIGRKPRVSTE